MDIKYTVHSGKIRNRPNLNVAQEDWVPTSASRALVKTDCSLFRKQFASRLKSHLTVFSIVNKMETYFNEKKVVISWNQAVRFRSMQ